MFIALVSKVKTVPAAKYIFVSQIKLIGSCKHIGNRVERGHGPCIL